VPILPYEPDIYPDTLLESPPTNARWWAVYTPPRHEKAFMRQLRQLKVPHYGPMITKRVLPRLIMGFPFPFVGQRIFRWIAWNILRFCKSTPTANSMHPPNGTEPEGIALNPTGFRYWGTACLQLPLLSGLTVEG